jgi:hypothetical protein
MHGVRCIKKHPPAHIQYFIEKKKIAQAAKEFTEDCLYGKDCPHKKCKFRHPPEELALIKARQEKALVNEKVKTKVCKFAGPDGSGCRNGDDCPYIHPKDKLPTGYRPCQAPLVDELRNLKV